MKQPFFWRNGYLRSFRGVGEAAAAVGEVPAPVGGPPTYVGEIAGAVGAPVIPVERLAVYEGGCPISEGAERQASDEVKATAGTRQKPGKLEVTKDEPQFTLPLPNEDEWLILQHKGTSDAKAITARITIRPKSVGHAASSIGASDVRIWKRSRP